MKHQLLRRVAVFPIQNSGVANTEEAWWQMREALTKDQRFMVASRRFMVNRGVYQPRRELKAADAIILGKILDAQALIVSFIDERRFLMKVYDGENGYALWEGAIEFHPVQSMGDQVAQVGQKLIQDFLAEMPYQGFVLVDPVRGKAIFDEGERKNSWVFHGEVSKVDVGDTAQIIEYSGDISRPLFQNGQATVLAEGVVREVGKDRVLISIERLRAAEDIRENALVRFPKEMKRLQELYSHQQKEVDLSAEYLASEMKPANELEKRHSTTATSLAFIVNLTAMILLAF